MKMKVQQHSDGLDPFNEKSSVELAMIAVGVMTCSGALLLRVLERGLYTEKLMMVQEIQLPAVEYLMLMTRKKIFIANLHRSTLQFL